MSSSLQAPASHLELSPPGCEARYQHARHLSCRPQLLPARRYLTTVFLTQRVELKRLEHERQRAIQRKVFEEQMRALEQQQQQELLSIPYDSVGLAVSAPTTPPRVNAVLHGDNFIKSALSHSSVDAEVLSKAVGFAVADKRKSVAYAPSVDLSPELGSGNGMNGQFNRAGAKSMPASRRTSTSSHDEELVEHFRGMALSGERPTRATPSPGAAAQSLLARGRYDGDDHARSGQQYNVGMMLDEQLDQEMHSEFTLCPFWSIVPHVVKML